MTTIKPLISQPTADPGAAKPQEDPELKKACGDFEAVLLNTMFTAMRQTLEGDALLAGGHQKEIYESMFYQEMALQIAQGKGMGIGEALYRQLQGDQEAGKIQSNGRLSDNDK